MKTLLEQTARDRIRNAESGFTLIEILIGFIMASIILTAAFGSYITQHNQFMVQEDVSEIQANARAVAEMLAQELRKTGYQLPSIVTPIEASNTDPETLTIKYVRPVMAGIALDQDMTSQYDNLSCNGNSLDGLVTGDWVFIYDEAADTGEAFMVSDINYHNYTVYRDTSPLGRAYPASSRLFAVERDRFYIDNSDSTRPNLMIEKLGGSPEVFAENIEDLNFVYYFEDGTSSNILVNPGQVRMIGINVVAKSFRPNLNNADGEIRRRDFTLKIKLRNFGLS